MSGTIQSRAKRPPALPLLPPAGPGSGLPLRSPPILRCTASSGGAAATGKEGKVWAEARLQPRARCRRQLTAPGEPWLPFGLAYEDPFLQVFFWPKQSET